MTHREIIKEINDLRDFKDAMDLLKSLPAWHVEMQDKIIFELNKHLESELRRLHAMLMQLEIK